MGSGQGEAELAAGTLVAGKYQLQSVLGRGAMGRVYDAIHLDLGRRVALKVLKNLRTDDAVLVRRFRREAQTAARLDHPHAVRVLDFGEDPKAFLYIVMEYVDAKPLSRVLSTLPRFPWKRACKVLVQVADALATAHVAGVIHRDVKPSNVLLGARATKHSEPQDYAKVCDFGLAKFETDHMDPDATQDPKWKAAGTPIYMAPEQAVGDPLDGRADVYATGVMAYHLLVGRPPFLADTASRILMMHVSKPPPPMGDIGVPQELHDLVKWCLAKDADQRCPDAETLADRLRAILASAGTGTMGSGARGWVSMTDDLVPPVPLAQAETQVLAVLPEDALRPLDPAPASPETPEPSGLDDLEALVAEAAAEAASEATSDLSGPKDMRMAGLDTRHHSSAIADRAAYMYTHFGVTYEPYHGAHPFYARDHRGELLGPLKYSDLWLVIQRCAEMGEANHVIVSADSERWTPLVQFVKWVGQESLLDTTAASLTTHDLQAPARISGRLPREGPMRVLARVAKERLSGRLIFTRDNYGTTERVEVHVINGVPTFVYSSDPNMQIPELLASKNLMPRDQMAASVHQCLASERALDSVIAEQVGVDVRQWRSVFMKERLMSIFSWGSGAYLFDDETLPSATRPFASSLLSVSKDLIYRALSEDTLLSFLAPYLGAPPQPTELFRGGLVEMRLSQGQTELLHKVFKARTIGEGLNVDPQRRRIAAALLFVAVEADLLRRP